MALSIKDPEADRLIREITAITGESITDAARAAFAERLQRLATDETARRARIDALLEQIRALPIVDERSADDMIGYDENGLPA